MSKVTTAILIAALLCGCSMSNDEVIKESNKCKAAGLKTVTVLSLFDVGVGRIVCMPMESASKAGDEK